MNSVNTVKKTATKVSNMNQLPNVITPGDLVLLKPAMIGPFRVVEQVGQWSFRLALPPAMNKMKPVFHVALLKPYAAPYEEHAFEEHEFENKQNKQNEQNGSFEDDDTKFEDDDMAEFMFWASDKITVASKRLDSFNPKVDDTPEQFLQRITDLFGKKKIFFFHNEDEECEDYHNAKYEAYDITEAYKCMCW